MKNGISIHSSLIFFIIFTIIIAGCTQYQPTTNGTTSTSGITSTEANSAIQIAQNNYQSVNNNFQTISQPYNEAVSKGVETTSSGPLVLELQSKLANANYLLNLALSSYNSRNYHLAKSYAEQSSSASQGIRSKLNLIAPALETDYKQTAAKYKPLLTEAERQYKIAGKYVETVQKFGVDVTPYQAQLNGLSQTLTTAKNAYSNNNYLGLSTQITSVVTTSHTIQKDLTDLYYTALISDSVKKAEGNITNSEARTYLTESKTLLQQKKFEDSVTALNKAILTESQANLVTNLEKIKQYIRNELSQDTVFSQYDTRVTTLNSRIKSGDFNTANEDIRFLKADIALIPNNVAKVVAAKHATDDLSTLNFWWASTPDIATLSGKLSVAKQSLTKGDHKSAAVSAQSAIESATSERMTFWDNVRSDLVLGTMLTVTKLYSDPEIYSVTPVTPLLLTWTINLDPIKIEFGRPIVDITDIDIQDPTIPSIPTVTPSATPTSSSTSTMKPVDFTLDSGNPTSCGTTCKQTTATITNTGDSTAHNVCVVLTVSNSNGDQIYLNGGPNIQKCIGDLAGGQSKSEPITINAECGLFYTKCIGQTLTLKCQATSTEKTVQFPNKVMSA